MEPLLFNSGIILNLLLIYVTVVYLMARISHDNSVMDIAYGPAFFISMLGASILGLNTDTLPAVMSACIGLWATRLGIRIARKNIGNPEDARYAKWRKEWLQHGRLYFLIRSYLQINLLQGAIIFLVLTPGIIALSFSEYYSPFFTSLGFVVFIFGLLYEMTADQQLDNFIARKKAGKEDAVLMTQGLFSLSRRPNYFGETLVWWGLAIMVLPLPFGFLGLISPILITYIVTKVTGPMLETAFLERYPEEYRAYISSTPYFMPRPLGERVDQLCRRFPALKKVQTFLK